MDDKQLQQLASQLARPTGAAGTAVGEKMNDVNAFITERSIEELEASRGERIVEIGPGNGILSVPIIESLGKGGHYIGLELSDDMARQAAENLKRHELCRVDIHCGDSVTAPVDENSIDGLIAVNVLYFFEDISAILARVSAWLKPGGRAIFGVRSSQSLKGMPFTRYGFHIRTLDEITDQLKANGFSNVESKYFDEGTSKLGDFEIPVDSLIIRADVT